MSGRDRSGDRPASRTWKRRLLGEVSTKREVMPGGRGMGGRGADSVIIVVLQSLRGLDIRIEIESPHKRFGSAIGATLLDQA
jgi:hypothetical protein